METCPNPEKGCKCEFHREVRAERQRRFRRRRAEREHGVQHDTDLIPVGPIRQKLRAAHRNGVTYREMEIMTGVSAKDLQRIANPAPVKRGKKGYQRRPQRWVSRATYQKIMTGLPENDLRAYQPNTMVPIKKARQVVRSLSAQGWATDHLAEIIANNTGKSGAFIRHLANPKRVSLTKSNEDTVLWLAEQIGARIGPAPKSKTWARNRGYFPQRHYDAMGDLIVTSLSPEQLELYERVRSTHA